MLKLFAKGAVRDGFITHDLLHWGISPSPGNSVARGAYVELPDMSQLSAGRANEFHELVSGWLKTAGNPNEGLQIRWTVESDYDAILESYWNDTERLPMCEFSRYYRKQLFDRWMQAQVNGDLRRERIAVFVSNLCAQDFPKGKGARSASVIDAYLEAQSNALAQRLRGLRDSVPTLKMDLMDDAGHYRYLRRFFNPGEVPLTREGAESSFDPLSTIRQNCVNSEAVFKAEDGSLVFKQGEKYHGIMVIRRWPSYTNPLVMRNITTALNKDFEITLSIRPLELKKFAASEEKMLRRNVSNASGGVDPASDVSAQVREERLRALQWGDISPFMATMTVRVWADSMRELQERQVRLMTAISTTGGMQYHLVADPGQAVSVYGATFPGLSFNGSPGWGLFIQNDALADLMPMQCSFTGQDTRTPHAIFESDAGSLVRVRLFTEDGTPLHAIALGVTRAGKGVTILGLLTQTDPYFAYTFIIDEGMSYTTWAQLHGSETIVFSSDCQYVFNPFDTQGAPLTGTQKGTIQALMMKMVGASGQQDVDRRRGSMIGEYVNRVYADAYDDFCKRNRPKMQGIWRENLAIHRWWRQKQPKDDLIAVCADIAVLRESDERLWQDWVSQFSNAEGVAFAQASATEQVNIELSHRHYGPKDYPVLSQVVEAMRAMPMDNHDPEEVDHLSTMLASWCSDGPYGAMFDGYSNFDMTGSVIHFELGQLPKGPLKEICGFLASSWIRQRVLTMPRNKRKRVVFEEANRFMDVPGGDLIVEEFYAQLGKFGTWVLVVSQSYAQLARSSVFSSILTNSKISFILRQKNREDLEDLAKRISLPDSAVERILTYRLPQTINPDIKGPKPVYFTLFTEDADGQVCGTAVALPTNEMFYVSMSNDDQFVARKEAMARYGDPLTCVLEESQKVFR